MCDTAYLGILTPNLIQLHTGQRDMALVTLIPSPDGTGKWEPEFDRGPHWRAQIGYVCVANADLTEDDLFRMKPPGVGVHFTRVPMPRECTVAGLAAMERGLADAASALMPGRDDLDVICYSCTSGTCVIGEERVIEELQRRNPRPQATTLLTGVVRALEVLEAKRLVIGTAYIDEVTEREAVYFTRKGFEVLRIAGLGLVTDQEMNRVTPSFLARFAREIDEPRADAIFLSCGALRSLEVIDEVERATGKPMIASNQASFWHCLRLAGIEDRQEGFGSLFRDH